MRNRDGSDHKIMALELICISIEILLWHEVMGTPESNEIECRYSKTEMELHCSSISVSVGICTIYNISTLELNILITFLQYTQERPKMSTVVL